MKKLAYITRKWWFFALLLVAQMLLMPFASSHFSPDKISDIIFVTLGHSLQFQLGRVNLYLQLLSLLVLILLLIFRNRMRFLFNLYVTLSYVAYAVLQNLAVTPTYGVSVVTVNVAMFLFVAAVWMGELRHPENSYDFTTFRWKHSWMIPLALFAYLCPVAGSGFDFNPIRFFSCNSATSFCLMTPMFLTLMTLNLPRVNVVTYRVTAIIGIIMGLYNMAPFANPYTVNIGILHLPLLIISLYATILSYRIGRQAKSRKV